MKLIIFSAIFGLAFCHPAQETFVPDLRPAVNKITSLIDFEAIAEIVHKVDLTTCDGYANISQYIYSPQFEVIHNHLWTDPQYIDIMSFIANAGYPELYEGLNHFYEMVGLPYRVDEKGPIESNASSKPKPFPPGPGTQPCNKEELKEQILEVLPADELATTIVGIVDNDQTVHAFFVKLAEPKMAESYQKFKALPEVQHLIEYAKERGIPIKYVLGFMESVFGWTTEPEDDVQ